MMGTGPTPTTVNIRQYTCDDASGCATGNDVGQVELVTLTSIVSYLISAVKAIWSVHGFLFLLQKHVIRYK